MGSFSQSGFWVKPDIGRLSRVLCHHCPSILCSQTDYQAKVWDWVCTCLFEWPAEYLPTSKRLEHRLKAPYWYQLDFSTYNELCGLSPLAQSGPLSVYRKQPFAPFVLASALVVWRFFMDSLGQQPNWMQPSTCLHLKPCLITEMTSWDSVLPITVCPH